MFKAGEAMAVIAESKTHWSVVHARNWKRILISVLLLAVAITLYTLAGDYTGDTMTTTVHDIVLDNIGPYNLGFLFIWLYLLVIALFFIYPLFFDPHELPYVISMFSLFFIVRSGFVILTHLRPPDDMIRTVFPGMLQVLNFSNDLFFSGHTGLPFFGFLVFRNNKLLRYFMLASSIVLGVTVLLMHVHYTIDVLSAFFIAYGTYKFGRLFVPADDADRHRTRLQAQHPLP
jgi:hypothetical protein